MSSSAYATENLATSTFSVTIDELVRIEPMTSPVLIANITDRTGRLHSPLTTKFRVISNSNKEKVLYLKSNVVTEGGYEDSMFEQGGRVYVAFANLAKLPKSSSLVNCKVGTSAEDSPGIVAYPITSIIGTEANFNKSKSKYEIPITNGTTYITVNIGTNVLKTSFGTNDPNGFYQAILSLTEADI